MVYAPTQKLLESVFIEYMYNALPVLKKPRASFIKNKILRSHI